MEEFWLNLRQIIPVAVVSVFFMLLYFIVSKILKRQSRGKADMKIVKQIILFLIVFIGLISFILTIPMSAALKGQITQLLGIVISAVIALSSATLIGNMFAGILLRIISSFKPGDFIEINQYFGRVSERGLFHTEIQTIDSDLITLPNLFLATNAVKVKRSSGTFIFAQVSLGYDIPRQKVEECLIRAAEGAGLEDNYVSILSLGDFSIVYEIHGKLNDIKKIISRRSLLRAMMLDELHKADIEIVSPTFMNQRQVNDQVFMPVTAPKPASDSQQSAQPEEQIFEKAEKAESIEKRRARIEELDEKIKQLQNEQKAATTPEAKAEFQAKIDKSRELKEKILSNIEIEQNKMEKD
jgi:small-conductance mechanosensitive channel